MCFTNALPVTIKKVYDVCVCVIQLACLGNYHEGTEQWNKYEIKRNHSNNIIRQYEHSWLEI